MRVQNLRCVANRYVKQFLGRYPDICASSIQVTSVASHLPVHLRLSGLASIGIECRERLFGADWLF